MDNYRAILKQLAVRGAFALLVFGLGWFLLATAKDGWGSVPRTVKLKPDT
ncbi:MAG: hypothetical protein ISS31_04640 [Kiritimatiellae bacterium]|nr:hypothetical protein [Kiritimatiellia bacterium]